MREIERKSGEIGGGLGEIAHFYDFLNIVFVAPDGLESGGKFPFINLKEGKMGVGCVGGGGEGGGQPRAKVGVRWGSLEMGRRGMLAWTSGWSSSYALASLRPSKILVSHWLQWNYCILVF